MCSCKDEGARQSGADGEMAREETKDAIPTRKRA
jgi:hypothetical protein